MELGALDGSPGTRSMTYEFENSFNWRRILVEGDPQYRENLRKLSPKSFSASAAICEKATSVHFRPAGYIGGILEFMGSEFLKSYHQKIYLAGTPPGNISSVNWTTITDVHVIDCMPLQHILHKAHTRHINFFILDVEVLCLCLHK